MVDMSAYRRVLSSHGGNIAEAKKNRSDQTMDRSWLWDTNYKRAYILTRGGWKFEDVKYQFHSAHSILRDEVDYYVQFRPKVHYPVGSYIIIPDDTSPEVNLSPDELEDPFLQPVPERTQWWMIVGRDRASAYVRYNILQCNWNFQWVHGGAIKNCFGAVRSANSYTSGRWIDEISSSLDNLIGAWLPDVHYVLGDDCEAFHVDDNRTLTHLQRFMVSNNALDPKVYQVTKIVDLSPMGIIKLSLKQDELNEDTDNKELRICDYYTAEGHTRLCPPGGGAGGGEPGSRIAWMFPDGDGQLSEDDGTHKKVLRVGETAYFKASFDAPGASARWRLEAVGPPDVLADGGKERLEGLVSLTEFGDGVLAVRPLKAGSIAGARFRLCLCDGDGASRSSIEMEVAG